MKLYIVQSGSSSVSNEVDAGAAVFKTRAEAVEFMVRSAMDFEGLVFNGDSKKARRIREDAENGCVQCGGEETDYAKIWIVNCFDTDSFEFCG